MDDRQLFAQFQTHFPARPRDGAYERLRDSLTRAGVRPRRTVFRVELPEPSLRLLATVVAVILIALVVTSAFISLFVFAHRAVQVHSPKFTSSCTQGFQMTDLNTGWSGASTRTTDGGKTWRTLSPPRGLGGECIIDGQRAYVARGTMVASSGPVEAIVYATDDGGATWKELGSAPIDNAKSLITLEFIDRANGWMLVEPPRLAQGLTRILYSTPDGGASWTRVSASGSSGLEQTSHQCGASGLSFINPTTGWITWECAQGYANTGVDLGPTAVVTTDGGRHWMPAILPEIPRGGTTTCMAGRPRFAHQGGAGVLPVYCSDPKPWAAVYRTADAGKTWTYGSLPDPAFYRQVSFVDPRAGYAYSNDSKKLYRTLDSGRTWSLVAQDVLGGAVDQLDFVDAQHGFADLRDMSGQAIWTTSNGGRTWRSESPQAGDGGSSCQPYSKPASPVPIAAFAGAVAWAQGALRTTDGGRHWTETGPPSVANRVAGTAEFYFDADVAWVAETAGSPTSCADSVIVFSTADGGRSWSQAAALKLALAKPEQIFDSTTAAASRQQPNGISSETFMDFTDLTHGWLMVAARAPTEPPTSVGPIYRTTDGGRTWSRVSDGIRGDANCGPWPSMRFATSNAGWIGDQACGGPATIYVTHDAGATWASEHLPAPFGSSVSAPVFVDDHYGFLPIGDDKGTTLISTDGGATWSTLQIPVPNASVYFIDRAHGWAVGRDFSQGRIAFEATADGGRTWNVRELPPFGFTSTISFVFADPGNGLASIDDKLYRTNDGGRTWIPVPYQISPAG